MPRDASGTYTRAIAAYVNGTIADADDVNDEMDDIASEMTDSLTASGKKAWGANQSGGGFWVNTLGNTRVYTTAGGTTAYTVTTGAALSNLTGRVIFVKWNATNTGASTLNVDGIGATPITKNGTTAVAAGDLVSGTCNALAFDGTNLQIVGATTTGLFQPLDATLTALAALSVSADQLIKATGSDTFSTQSFTSAWQTALADATAPRHGGTNAWTGANTWSRAGLPGRFTNTTDAAANQAAIFESDRATPAAFDQCYTSYFLSDSAGNQDEMARISAQATDVTSTTEDARFVFSFIVNGSLTAGWLMNAVALTPNSNDGASLGVATIGVADGFWASGATQNYNNGNVVLTHDNTNARLDLTTGSLKARTPTSTETSGTLSAASANCVVAATGDVTINDGVFTAGDFVMVYAGASARTITQDTGMTLRLHGTTTTGNRTLAVRGMATIYFISNSEAVVLGDVT